MQTNKIRSKINRAHLPLLLILLMVIWACKETRQEKITDELVTEIDSTDGFKSIFDGKTMKGWDGDVTYWRVENEILVGEITPETLLKTNTFIIYKGGNPSDFELKLDFKISENGNSGINYRSEQLDTIAYALRGYQADIDGKNRYTGQNYEERKRTTLAYRGEKAEILSQKMGAIAANVANNAWQSREILASLGQIDSLKTKIKKDAWNEAHLIVKGHRLQHFINGVLMSEVIDNDSLNRSASGKLGMQVHVGPPMKVEFRNIRLR